MSIHAELFGGNSSLIFYILIISRISVIEIVTKPLKRGLTYFVQVFCASLKGNTYGTKYRLSKDKSVGLG